MVRRSLSGPIWEQLQIIVRKKDVRIQETIGKVLEAILWKIRAGAPWRGCPC